MSLIRLLRSPGSSPKTILTGCLAALPLLQCYSVVRNKDNHPVVVRTKFPLTRAMVPGLLECFKMGDGGAYKNAVKLAAETAKISTRKRQRDEVFGSEQLQQGHQDLSNVVWNSAIFPCRWLPVLRTMKIRAGPELCCPFCLAWHGGTFAAADKTFSCAISRDKSSPKSERVSSRKRLRTAPCCHRTQTRKAVKGYQRHWLRQSERQSNPSRSNQNTQETGAQIVLPSQMYGRLLSSPLLPALHACAMAPWITMSSRSDDDLVCSSGRHGGDRPDG